MWFFQLLSIQMSLLQSLTQGVPYTQCTQIYNHYGLIPQSPPRHPKLSKLEFQQAIRNALRYFPPEYHQALIPEFAKALRERGHIWMENLKPTDYTIQAYPIHLYPAKITEARAIQLMIMNNLDNRVAQYPDQLITYGGNGSVFSNWAQYHLTMKYLSEMEEDQTLVMYSGHPLGLFPSTKYAPRVIISNGQMVPNYSSSENYEKYFAMGVSQFGQMTAGSYCYIGPQGIVHDTTLTILNAIRRYLNDENRSGLVFVSSGLGALSSAQPKAAQICGIISVIAEVKYSALQKCHSHGWVAEITRTVQQTIDRIKLAKLYNETTSIAFNGNIVELLEGLAKEEQNLVDLLSDQTSLHDPYGGGYYPVDLSVQEADNLTHSDPERFKTIVDQSLRRHVAAIDSLVAKGAKFWDYGNSFLLAASKAGVNLANPDDPSNFRYPSYIEDIMGGIQSLGFGPFRWVCTSCSPRDLHISDKVAESIINELLNDPACPQECQAQYRDSLLWIQKADENHLVVGSQARILFSDTMGRIALVTGFNQAIRSGDISAPIVISGDHHGTSGADSPYSETSNILDGSKFTADMAIQTALGNVCRGATWVSLHNGGGVGWGEVINTGYGIVLDGTDEQLEKARVMLQWDTQNGLARRGWSGDLSARETLERLMQKVERLKVTLPFGVKDGVEVPEG